MPVSDCNGRDKYSYSVLRFLIQCKYPLRNSHVPTEISQRLRDETVKCRREGWLQCIKNNKILLIIRVRRGSFPMYHHDVRDSTHFRQSGSQDHQFSNLDQNHRHFRVSRGAGLVIEPDLRSDNRILPIN